MWATVFEQIVENAAEAVRALRNALNWRLVRGVGQLQILTRASYVLLVVVPICAGTWPAVRLIVNQHNKAAREAADHLHATRADVERALEDARRQATQILTARDPAGTSAAPNTTADLFARLSSSVRTIGSVAERYTADYADHTIKTPKLPWSLGAAFFAALFVALGHFVYQLAAPEPIRQTNWDEFVQNRKEDYGTHPSDVALDRASEVLRSSAGHRVTASERFEDEQVLRQTYRVQGEERMSLLRGLSAARLRSLIGWIQTGRSEAPADYQREIEAMGRELLPAATTSTHSEMTMIERGARAEYLQLASQRPVAVVLTGTLYGLGLWLVLLIIKVQATAVITAAEWHSVRDLFLP